MPERIIIPIGSIFGRLTVVSEAPARPNSKGYSLHYANVECVCGNKKQVLEMALRIGKTKSCGCLQKEKAKENLPKATHKKTRTPTYISWQAMRARCLNKNHRYFNYYGGRGIFICDSWNKFENFLKDMGERPAGMTIDRIDTNGNYEPNNCQWACHKTQHANRRNNKYVIVRGQKVCVAEASRILGICLSTINARAKRQNIALQESTDYYASKI